MKKMMKWLGVAFLVVTIAFLIRENSDMANVQKGIADKIIRFHVRANSDSDEDQKIKLAVKDEVCKYLEGKLVDSKSIDETREILETNVDAIRDIAYTTIASFGKEYEVEVYFENTYFPLKTYADMTFPPGVYEAFRIDIGDAIGKNWWCVMYPPLCFVDSTYAVVPEETKHKFQEVLTTKEYDAITIRNADSCEIDFEFKILEWLGK